MISQGITKKRPGDDVPRGHLAVIADPHLGPGAPVVGAARRQMLSRDLIESRGVQAFEDLIAWCVARRVESLIVAGDVFAQRYIPPKIIEQLIALFRRDDCPHVYLLSGNHDHDNYAGNALGYLSGLRRIDCIRTPCLGVVWQGGDTPAGVIWVPTLAGASAEDRIDLALRGLSSWQEPMPRLLVGHFGIYDEDGALPWMEHDPGYVGLRWLEERLAKTPVRLVAVGHNHAPRTWYLANGTSVFQIGAFAPRCFMDMGLDQGGILQVRGAVGGLLHAQRLPGAIPGPRFLEKPPAVAEFGANPSNRKCWFIVRCTEEEWPAALRADMAFGPPETLAETYGRVSSVAHFVKDLKIGDTLNIPEPTATPAEAVSKYVQMGLEQGKFKGPLVGLMREAMGRLSSVPNCGEVVAPSPQFGEFLYASRAR